MEGIQEDEDSSKENADTGGRSDASEVVEVMKSVPEDYQWLQMLQDIENNGDLLCAVMNRDSKLMRLLNSCESMGDDVIEAIICVISRASDYVGCPETLFQMLNIFRNSYFFKTQINKYIIAKFATLKSSTNLANISSVMKHLQKILLVLLSRMETSYIDVMVLNSTMENVVRLVQKKNCTLEKVICENIDEITEMCTTIAGNHSNKDAKKKRPPGNDFRLMTIVPTEDDLKTRKRLFLQKNKDQGAYENLVEYLDTHFRLMREDFLRPLREGIRVYRETAADKRTKVKLMDVYIYHDVKILQPVYNSSGISYAIYFDSSQLVRSKQLMNGSLLCLSRDEFNTVLFATVVNQPNDAVQRTEIAFLCDLDVIQNLSFDNSFEMVENTAYFEAYRYVLAGLVDIRDDFPFQEYLIHGIQDVKPPKYVAQNPDFCCDMTCLCKNIDSGCSERKTDSVKLDDCALTNSEISSNVSLLNKSTWPTPALLGLNPSQYKALDMALTSELAVIQGPPGTGKTMIGLKIMKCLLENKQLWTDKNTEGNTPVLVVCYTNHALDQFLEGISAFLPSGIVRVGGRSKSCILEKYTLKKLRRSTAVLLGKCETEQQMNQIKSDISYISNELSRASRSIVRENVLKDYMSDKDYDSLTSHFAEMNDKTLPQGGRDSVFNSWLLLNSLSQHTLFLTQDQWQFFEEEECALSSDDEGLVLDMPDDDNAMLQKETNGDHEDQTKKLEIKIQHLLENIPLLSESEAKNITKREKIYTLSIDDRWLLYHYWVSQYKNHLTERVNNLQRAYYNAACRLKELKNQEDANVIRTSQLIGMTTTGAAKYKDILQDIKPKIILVEEAAEVLEAHIITTLSPACEHLILIGDHQQLRPNPTVYELARKYKLNISLFERLINNGIPHVTLEKQYRMRPEISQFMHHIYQNLADDESVHDRENIKGIHKNVFFLSHKFYEKHDDEFSSKGNSFEAIMVAKLARYLLLQGYKAYKITVLTPYAGQLVQLRKHMEVDQLKEIQITTVDNFQGEENDIILISLVRSSQQGGIGFLRESNRTCVMLSRARIGMYVIGNFDIFVKQSQLWKEIIESAKKGGYYGDELQLYCQNHPQDEGIRLKHFDDFQRAPDGGCNIPCDVTLKCGHQCGLKCHSYDKKHELYMCQEIVGDCRECGHQFFRKCSHPEDKHLECEEMVPKTKENCGHLLSVPCSSEIENVKCDTSCTATLSCNHKCTGDCGKCFQGRLHMNCLKVCERILVCGHSFQALCYKDCPPCSKLASYSCAHRKYFKRCSQPLNWCKEPCAWQCKHHKCDRQCYEPCIRARCNEPCTETLSCGHLCKGLCGETCPRCPICRNNEITENIRYVELHGCRHLFPADELDKWMDDHYGKQAKKSELCGIQFPRCPKCHTPILRNLRYGGLLNQTLADMEAVNYQLSDQKVTQKTITQPAKSICEMFKKKNVGVCKFTHGRDQIQQKEYNSSQVRVMEQVAVILARLNDKEKNDRNWLFRFQNWSADKIYFMKQLNEFIRWCKMCHFSTQELQQATTEMERIDLFETLCHFNENMKSIESKKKEYLAGLKQTMGPTILEQQRSLTELVQNMNLQIKVQKENLEQEVTLQEANQALELAQLEQQKKLLALQNKSNFATLEQDMKMIITQQKRNLTDLEQIMMLAISEQKLNIAELEQKMNSTGSELWIKFVISEGKRDLETSERRMKLVISEVERNLAKLEQRAEYSQFSYDSIPESSFLLQMLSRFKNGEVINEKDRECVWQNLRTVVMKLPTGTLTVPEKFVVPAHTDCFLMDNWFKCTKGHVFSKQLLEEIDAENICPKCLDQESNTDDSEENCVKSK